MREMDFIFERQRTAWQRGLDVLKPTQAQLEHGLELHDNLFVCDPLTVMDQVRDTKNTEINWMDHITLNNAFRRLNDREKQILSLRFYDGKTQMEVASTLGISQAQVSRLEKGAISAMRKSVSVS